MTTLTKTIAAAAFGILATTGFAHAATDTLDYTDNGSGYYFVAPTQSPTQYPSSWYRDANQDWGWQHAGVAGTDAKLNIGAWDVDASPCGTSNCEEDMIQAYDTDSMTWVDLGLLDGADNAFAFTEFDIWNYGGGILQNEIATGLQVRIDIDQLNAGWLVTLSKSVITTDGGNPGNPNPGAVPLPAGAWLMLTAIGGIAAMRRRKKA